MDTTILTSKREQRPGAQPPRAYNPGVEAAASFRVLILLLCHSPHRSQHLPTHALPVCGDLCKAEIQDPLLTPKKPHLEGRVTWAELYRDGGELRPCSWWILRVRFLSDSTKITDHNPLTVGDENGQASVRTECHQMAVFTSNHQGVLPCPLTMSSLVCDNISWLQRYPR